MKKLTGNIGRKNWIRQQPIHMAQQQMPSAIDTTLIRLANLSQVGLLALAIFGYFYTVLPVYQKSLLDEEIAKKTLELNSVEKKITSLESELSEKNLKLANLNTSLFLAQKDLGKSRAEIGTLHNKVDSQYSELRIRLLEEFELLTIKLCPLPALPDNGFASCVNEKVLSSENLSALTAPDRKRLQLLVSIESESLHAKWREFKKGLQQQRVENEQMKNELMKKCEELKASEEYKDKAKKINTDLQCSINAENYNSNIRKLRVIEYSANDDFLNSELQNIANKFLNPKK